MGFGRATGRESLSETAAVQPEMLNSASSHRQGTLPCGSDRGSRAPWCHHPQRGRGVELHIHSKPSRRQEKEKEKKKKKKKEVRREGVPSAAAAAAAISAAGPASVLPPRLVLPSHPLPKKNKNKIQNSKKESLKKRRKRKSKENIKNKSKKWGNPKISKRISRFGAVVVCVGVLFGCGLYSRFLV